MSAWTHTHTHTRVRFCALSCCWTTITCSFCFFWPRAVPLERHTLCLPLQSSPASLCTSSSILELQPSVFVGSGIFQL